MGKMVKQLSQVSHSREQKVECEIAKKPTGDKESLRHAYEAAVLKEETVRKQSDAAYAEAVPFLNKYNYSRNHLAMARSDVHVAREAMKDYENKNGPL